MIDRTIYLALYEADPDGAVHEITDPNYARRVMYADEWNEQGQNLYPIMGFTASRDIELVGYAAWDAKIGGTRISAIFPIKEVD